MVFNMFGTKLVSITVNNGQQNKNYGLYVHYFFVVLKTSTEMKCKNVNKNKCILKNS